MILGGFFDPDKLSNDLLTLQNKLQDPEIWKDHKKLNELNKQKTVLETKVNEYSDIENLAELSHVKQNQSILLISLLGLSFV